MRLDNRKTDSAVFLIDEYYCGSNKNKVPSGWDLDYRGHENPKDNSRVAAHNMKTSNEGKYALTMARTFTLIEHGKATLVHSVYIRGGDGFFTELYSSDGKTALCLEQKNGFFYVNGIKTDCVAENKGYTFRFDFDVDSKKFVFVIDGKYIGEYNLTAINLYKIKTGYKAGSIGDCDLSYTGLWINYLVCDRNFFRYEGALPYGWQDECDNGCSASSTSYSDHRRLHTYTLSAKNGKTAKASKVFDKACGVVSFEIKYYSENADGELLKFSFTKEGKECVSVLDNGTSAMKSDLTTLRSHHAGVWQRLRIDADTETQKALVWLNGKKCGYIDFDEKADFFDGISVSCSAPNETSMQFTDVYVNVLLPEPEDYPKEPVMPTRKYDIYTGMNICSLWREGSHYGWENIVNFDENMPILGPYDEGITEVADWEIKYMAEHGLDCQFYCWYAKQHNAPLLKTALSEAMEYGHMYAKYSDKVKFALIWEASNSYPLTSLEEFKKYYVPYWIDHFFSDDRYFRIDGVAILAIFGLGRLIKDLQGTDKVKECIDYLRSELIKIGYKGLAVISNTQPCNDSVNSGMSASYAYHWGYMGFNPEHQKTNIRNHMSSGRLHVTPTISVGYNDIAWRVADRVPYISQNDFNGLINWAIDDVLSTYKDMPEGWQKKLLMFSTWNEYGEGTYMCPAGVHGFGYLNEMRKALTVEGDCLDSEKPSQTAYDRLGYLFPRGRKLICTPQTIPTEIPEKVVAHIDFTSEEAIGKYLKNIRFVNCEGQFKDGKLCGQSTAYDPQIYFETDFDASEVDVIRVKMRSAEECFDKSKMIDKPTTCHLFFATEENPELSWDKRSSPNLVPEMMFLSKLTTWNGKVKVLRLDPTNGEGIYEIESFTFLKYQKEKTLTYIDGRLYDSHYEPKVEDGEIYISFEPLRDFNRLLNIYHEWDDETQTLMTDYDGKVYYWTKDSNIIRSTCGDIIMKKPLEFYDGLPYMPMSVLSEITGCSYSEADGKLIITTAK